MTDKPDHDKIAKALGATRGGKVSAKGGYFGALQTAAEVKQIQTSNQRGDLPMTDNVDTPYWGQHQEGTPETISWEWPLVDKNDDGIRPAGKPNECFYCRNCVGSPHGQDCVMITKRIEMKVIATMPEGDTLTGTWEFNEPYDWDVHMSEFHKNESSWCAGNFVHCNGNEAEGIVKWDGDSEQNWARIEALEAEGSCLCDELLFEFIRVVDGTPQRRIRQQETNKENKEVQ